MDGVDCSDRQLSGKKNNVDGKIVLVLIKAHTDHSGKKEWGQQEQNNLVGYSLTPVKLSLPLASAKLAKPQLSGSESRVSAISPKYLLCALIYVHNVDNYIARSLVTANLSCFLYTPPANVLQFTHLPIDRYAYSKDVGTSISNYSTLHVVSITYIK